MKKIAVVEDDLVLREALTGLLEENGYETCVVEDFQRAREVLLAMEPDLVLLDILLPGANGQEILRSLRKESQIPVIMLTSRSGDRDEILSMSYGADDYIVKPYNPTLLLLKLEALFRRMGPKEHTGEIQYGPVTVNLLRSTMRWEDREVVLSKNEISILYYLVKNRGRIVSRDELMDYLWDCSDFVDDNTLTVNMNRLRKKLQEAGVEHAVETRRKQGYILI